MFAIGWSEEILPHHKAEDINEERRIAYVIATRAKDLLRVSSLESWNDAVTSPSRFLTGLNLAMASAPAADDEIENAPFDESVELPELGGLFVP